MRVELGEYFYDDIINLIDEYCEYDLKSIQDIHICESSLEKFRNKEGLCVGEFILSYGKMYVINKVLRRNLKVYPIYHYKCRIQNSDSYLEFSIFDGSTHLKHDVEILYFKYNDIRKIEKFTSYKSILTEAKRKMIYISHDNDIKKSYFKNKFNECIYKRKFIGHI